MMLINTYPRVDGQILEPNKFSNPKFFPQSELIEPVSPQAAQPGIHFYCFHNTQLEMHLLEGPDEGHSTGEGK